MINIIRFDFSLDICSGDKIQVIQGELSGA